MTVSRQRPSAVTAIPGVAAAVVLIVAATLVAGTAAEARPLRDRPFQWPLQPRPPVVTAFDPPPRPWLPGHRGVDLDARMDPTHTVRAAGTGIVVFAGPVAGRDVLSIEHPGGIRTTYEPVASSLEVGDRVAIGDPVGTVVAGHPGCAARWCLHWGMRRGREYLDPTVAVGAHRVVLLPVAAGVTAPT
ncbi:MAG: M23 family metallopeptidase [Rhodococcus sp. (in: high G+C Gram-positive bacteria)]